MEVRALTILLVQIILQHFSWFAKDTISAPFKFTKNLASLLERKCFYGMYLIEKLIIVKINLQQ